MCKLETPYVPGDFLLIPGECQKFVVLVTICEKTIIITSNLNRT